MKFAPSAGLVKRALASHAWVGLLAGAIMYVVCLSGTIAVLYPWLERWEQPAADEFTEVTPEIVQRVFAREIDESLAVTDHLYVSLPTPRLPRLALSNEETGFFVNQDGSLGEEVRHAWTHLLVELHLYLHLPNRIGIVVVSTLGVLLCALVISGLLAHPNILRDAFSLRLRGSRQLEQVDLHNRLSVWGLPFHLMIGITGAYFGLVLPMLALVSALTGTPGAALSASVFGEEPEIETRVETPNVGRAISQVQAMAPESHPFTVIVHEATTDTPLVDVYATWPGRLTWGEQYRFDGAGNFIGTTGFADGEVGKQAVYSIYRLHFGHFGGWPVQAIYLLLGLALTVVAATGVNIWLEKRRRHDWINDAWVGVVWGMPLGLTVSAFTQVILGIGSVGIFWLVMAAAIVAALSLRDVAVSRRWLQRVWSIALAMLLAGHALRFGIDAVSPAAVVVNGVLATTLLVLIGHQVTGIQRVPDAETGRPV